MEDQLVLVTGASGFVASHVIKQLQEAGYKVRATVRSLKNEKKCQHIRDLCPDAKFKVELVEADLIDADCWTKVMEGVTYVHHVASPLPLDNPQNEADVIRPAEEGTLNVLRACVAAKTVKRAILTGTALTIAHVGNNEKPYTEEDWVDPKTPGLNAYTKAKILAEKAAWKFMKELPEDNKLELVVVVPALITGPPLQDTFNSSVEFVRRLLERAMPAVPKLNFPATDVRDVALAHLKCMTVDEVVGHRVITVAGNKWMKEMAVILDKEFRDQGYNVPLRELPSFVLWVASFFDKALNQVRKHNSVMTFDSKMMREVLKTDPIPLDKSVVDMAYASIEKGFITKTDKYKKREP